MKYRDALKLKKGDIVWAFDQQSYKIQKVTFHGEPDSERFFLVFIHKKYRHNPKRAYTTPHFTRLHLTYESACQQYVKCLKRDTKVIDTQVKIYHANIDRFKRHISHLKGCKTTKLKLIKKLKETK